MTEQDKRALVVATCAKYDGTKESPAGSNNVIFNTRFYGREVKDGFDLQGKPNKSCTYAWCFTSVSEIFIEAGFHLGNIGYRRGAAGVPYAKERIKQWGTIVPLGSAQPGDIVLIDFKKDGKWDHVGILKKLASSLEIWEGNTSRDNAGSQSNGGEYCLKTRSLATMDVVIVRPNCYDRDQDFSLKK